MNTIYKYPIEVTDLQEVEMPQGSRILAVQTQRKNVVEDNRPRIAEDPYLWALVNTEEGKTDRRLLRIYGTGHPIREPLDKLDYIGTFQQGPFVWHVFERKA